MKARLSAKLTTTWVKTWLRRIYISKFQGFGDLGGPGQLAVYPVAQVSSVEGESATPHHLGMAAPLVWGMKPTYVPVALSHVLWMATGRRGIRGVNAV